MSNALPRRDQTTFLGDAIAAEVRAARLPFEPEQFEFWFTYKSGRNLALNAAADALRAGNGALTGRDIEQLHREYISPWRAGDGAPGVATRLIGKLQDLSATIEDAIGSMQESREVLAAEVAELAVNNALTLKDVLCAIDRMSQSAKESRLRLSVLEARIDSTNRDISAIRRQLGTVRDECNADPTTALPGRRAFDATLAKAIEDGAASRKPVSVLLCDLDYFASFNQNFGTFVGDEVLRSVGVLFKAHMRAEDTVARYESDAYAAILPRTRASEAMERAEQFRRALMTHEMIPHENGAGRVTISIGTAETIKGDTPEFLLRRVNNGLAVAKREGRNRVVEMTPDGPVWDAGRQA
jgi:diguanylate cyclase (GGDEF)-like protein